ncbi:MAG: DUF6777 domain-containing protein [Actinomycetota bacterium]
MTEQPTQWSWSTLSRRRRPVAVVAAVAIVVGVLAFVVVGGSSEGGPLQVVPVGASELGPVAFADIVVPAQANFEASVLPEVVTSDSDGLFVAASGTCDRAEIDGALDDPERRAAWADAVGTTPDDVSAFLAGLDEQVVATNLVVDETGWDDDESTAVERVVVLEPGTLVLVDDEGQPRLRCRSATPLAPASIDLEIELDAEGAWPGLDEGSFVRIDDRTGTRVTVTTIVATTVAVVTTTTTTTTAPPPTTTTPPSTSTTTTAPPVTVAPPPATTVAPPPASTTVPPPAPTTTPPPASTTTPAPPPTAAPTVPPTVAPGGGGGATPGGGDVVTPGG